MKVDIAEANRDEIEHQSGPREKDHDPMRLSEKVALITGAASGIGRAAAVLFAQEGAKVMVTDINEESGEKVAADIRAVGGSASFCYADVANPASVANAVARTVAELGALDIVYNNAGGSRPGDKSVTETPVDEFWRTLEVDLFGTWLCCKYGIPEMIKAGRGAIVNTSSVVALIGYPGKDSYTAAKGAIASLTRSMAVEYAPHAIRVNAVAPGVTMTDRVASRMAGQVAGNVIPQRLLDRHLLGLLEPGAIARAALFLASDDSSHITGQVVRVDSGLTVT